MGLVDKIRNADSREEIDALFAQGETFELVSKKTKARWRNVAKVRIKEIDAFNASQPKN